MRMTHTPAQPSDRRERRERGRIDLPNSSTNDNPYRGLLSDWLAVGRGDWHSSWHHRVVAAYARRRPVLKLVERSFLPSDLS